MARTLFVVAGAGILISAVCLSVADALGIDDWHDENFFGFDFAEGERCDRDSPTETRNFVWDGDDSVTLTVPGRVRYRPGTGTDMTATGPGDFIDHLRVRDGRVALRCRNAGREDLTITLPGRAFRDFTVNGATTLTLENLDQPRLALKLRGSGTVEATGSAGDMELEITGSGDARLGGLKVASLNLRISGSGEAEAAPEDEADVVINGSGDARLTAAALKRLRLRINGSGDAEAAPLDDADITINGSGRVRLRSRPHNLETQINGSGRVITDDTPAPAVPAR